MHAAVSELSEISQKLVILSKTLGGKDAPSGQVYCVETVKGKVLSGFFRQLDGASQNRIETTQARLIERRKELEAVIENPQGYVPSIVNGGSKYTRKSTI